MADNKRLIQIQVLVKVDADTTDKASVLGGNLVRTLQNSIPNVYEIVGVELQSTDADVGKRGFVAPEKDKEVPVLKT